MRVKTKIIEITQAEQTFLDKILSKPFPLGLLYVEVERKDKTLRERNYYLVLSVTKEGLDYFLNFTVKREDEL